MGNARNLADLLGTSTKANQVISTSGAVTTTGAFTSVGIDDNADATTITIDSSERVGIGTTSPSHQLHIESSGSNTYATMKLEGQNRGGQIDMFQNTVITNQILGDQSGNLYFNTSGAFGNTSATTKLTLGTAGDLTVNSGNLVIGTSGKGIDFSATGDAFASAGSELLDDYEEGAYNFSTNGFSQQTTSQGFYVRIGKMCHVTMAFHALGSQNSNTFTNSLPFTSAANQYSSNTGYGMNCVWPVMSNNCDTGTAGLRAFVVANTNYIKIYKENEDGAWAAVSNNFMSSEDQFYTSGWFLVA